MLKTTALAARLCLTALAAGSIGVTLPGPAALAAIPAPLGDLAAFRAIAQDTLGLVGKGDIPAARARIKDLETSWDKAEPTLRPKDQAAWHRVDKAIDEALAAVRTPNPQATACATALQSLIRTMDAAR